MDIEDTIPAAVRAELLIGHLQGAWVDVAKVLDTVSTYKNHTVLRRDLRFLQEQVHFALESLTSLKDDVALAMAELGKSQKQADTSLDRLNEAWDNATVEDRMSFMGQLDRRTDELLKSLLKGEISVNDLIQSASKGETNGTAR